MEKKNVKLFSAIALVALALLVVGATYAYFQNQYGSASNADVKVTTYTTDVLTFETGDAINISADQETFAQGKGNQTGSTFARATLQANNKTNTATANYYVYLLIENNEFSYSANEDKPELILNVTDDEGNDVTIDGLTKKTVTDGKKTSITGYDVTLNSGLLTLLNNKTIEVISSDNGKKIENWNITLTLVNYDFDQNNNAGKSFNAKLLIQKDFYPTVVGDVCNNGDNLAGCIATLNNKSENYVTNIYHHDGTIKDSEGNILDAEDNSYRYSGFEYENLYSCKYNGIDVKNYRGAIDNSFAEGCDNVYKVVKPKTNTIEYYDNNTFTDEEISVSWDSVNSKCIDTNGTQVYYFDGVMPTQEQCTGNVRKYMHYNEYAFGITEVGSGIKSLTMSKRKINNFVCFGYDGTGTCPTDNLYRIIGVFDSKVKLIKYDYAKSTLLGTNGDYKGIYENPMLNYKGDLQRADIAVYYYNYNGLEDKTINKGYGSGDWSTSLLNKTNLNTNYLNNIGTKWSNIIASSIWYYGSYVALTPKALYQKEIQMSPYEAKVGINSFSDYYFSINPIFWKNDIRYDFSPFPKKSWMYLGLREYTFNANHIITCLGLSFAAAGGETAGSPIRPNFYLDSSVQYSSGSGTSTDPIRIKL